jgi:hypothetical protein
VMLRGVVVLIHVGGSGGRGEAGAFRSGDLKMVRRSLVS